VWCVVVLVVLALVLSSVPLEPAVDRLVVEDWQRQELGKIGIPSGWEGQTWGSPRYDLRIEDDGGRKVLHLRSENERSTISRKLPESLDLRSTPVLEWAWKVTKLPPGGDARKRETTDQAAQIYVTWPRFPEAMRSRILGYAWDTSVPAGTVVKSKKTGTVTYIIVRSGQGDLGQWLTERRNVREDYRRVFGEEPDGPPRLLSISIDSNDTRSAAESFVGPIAFAARAVPSTAR
jgi:hypothetical protein